MRRLLVVLLVGSVALAAASASEAERPTAMAAKACDGTVAKKINGHTVKTHGITTYAIGCATGKRVIRRFLKKADRHEGCNVASKKPPPTKGCLVGHFHCFRNGNTYCAAPVSKSVSWKE